MAGGASERRVRRAGARGLSRRHPRPAECGKIVAAQCPARRDVAIVTDEPGTTRDVLEVPLDLGGYPVVLFDTAGLREADIARRAEGVRRAELTAEIADLVALAGGLRAAAPEPPPAACPTAPIWRVPTKIDLAPALPSADLGISASNRRGLDRARLNSSAKAAAESLGAGSALVTRQRQKEAIVQALAALGCRPRAGRRGRGGLAARGQRGYWPAERASRCRGRARPAFSEFCIGK